MKHCKSLIRDSKVAEINVVTVATSAVKSTMGGSGPIQEIDATGGTKYG